MYIPIYVCMCICNIATHLGVVEGLQKRSVLVGARGPRARPGRGVIDVGQQQPPPAGEARENGHRCRGKVDGGGGGGGGG